MTRVSEGVVFDVVWSGRDPLVPIDDPMEALVTALCKALEWRHAKRRVLQGRKGTWK